VTIVPTTAEMPSLWMPAVLARGGVGRWTLLNLIALVSYFALGLIVNRFFAAYGVFPAPIWLPAGAAMVLAMIGGLRVLPGLFLGSFLTNMMLFDAPWGEAAIISATNALGPVLGALLLRRLRPANGLFTSFVGVIAFLGCTTFLSPAVSATGGAVGISLGEPFVFDAFYSTWVNWWLTDSGGTLYLTPCLVLWLGLEQEGDEHIEPAKRGFQRRDLVVWAWVAAVSLVLFLTPPLRGTYIRSAFPFLLVVPLSWIALRMSLRSAYTLVTLVSIAATAGTVAGVGPFQNHGLANPLQLVGVLVVLLAMNVLTIVALVSERHGAQSANRVKAMFLANTSHELRTPLNAIIGFSRLIAEQPGRSPDIAAYARTINTSGEHLLALINDLLEMSKIEAGRFELREETIVLADVVAEATSLLAMPARAKSVSLTTEIAVPEAVLTADGKAIRQILINLLSNAVKFTPEGGRVGLDATISDAGELVLRVTDTGIGIPPEAQVRIFQPFERVHDASARKQEGTGLGLSITRGLVTLHGGSIALDSVVGRGTIVSVSLPASRVSLCGPAAVPGATARLVPG
jgi:two-component system cell cycle sensor histidine kinase PleC